MTKLRNSHPFDYCPQLKSLYLNRSVKGRSGKVFNGLAALSTVNNLVLIRSLMLETKPLTTLEVGMAFGGSTLAFAATHRDLGHEPSRQHTAIDPAQSSYWDSTGTINLEEAKLAGFVEVIEAYSSMALPKLVEGKRIYGMAYIDGSHQFEDVLLDFVYTHEMLEVGGCILFDDSTDSQIAKVLGFIEANYNRIYEPISLTRFKTSHKARIRHIVASHLRKTQLRAYRKIREGRQNWGAAIRQF